MVMSKNKKPTGRTERKGSNSSSSSNSNSNNNNNNPQTPASFMNAALASEEELALPRLVIARTGSTSKFREYSFYRHLESLGVPVLNSPISINYCSNKFRTYMLLAENNVPIPRTILLDCHRDLKLGANEILKLHNMELPVVLKFLDSSGGRGVFLARDEKELSSLLRMAQSSAPAKELIAQECVKESMGMDVRVWVVGNKALGACMRHNKTDFRSNVGQGGFPYAIDLDDEARDIAIRATQALGLDWSGVDLLLSHQDPKTGKRSWKVGEVNSSPGWDKDADKLINVELGEEIIDHICQRYGIGLPKKQNEKENEKKK